MARKDAQLNPAAQSLDYLDRKEDWDLATALLGGTRAMRDANMTYLPQHSEEEGEAYAARLEQTVLYNAFEEAVDGVASRVFAEPVILKEEEAAPLLKEHAGDITGLGENLDGFARRCFQSAVAYGIAWLFVDSPNIAPEIEEEVDGKVLRRSRTGGARSPSVSLICGRSHRPTW